ncbi:type VI secretion system membrane subunit TssM [Erwinia amylovora]
MSINKNWISGNSARNLLIIGCFILLALCIWFVAPYLGFGQVKPWARIETRCIFILLSLLYFLAFFYYIPFIVMLAMTLCVMIWEISPFISIGEKHPFFSYLARAEFIAIVLMGILIYACCRFLLRSLKDPDFINKFSKSYSPKADENPVSSDAVAVIRNAANYSRKVVRTSFWRYVFSLNKNKQPALPWYMVLGPENAGKTSLILSSGQDFPLPEQLNRIGKENSPTEHCECWFANDALFIDTSGKYVNSKESPAFRDEWRAIISEIKKKSSVKGINGAIITVSSADIIGKTKVELVELSSDIRSRLNELRDILAGQFPIYFVVTKMDLFKGFETYFRSLTSEEREQIWGTTFHYKNKKLSSADELQKHIENELVLLFNRIDGNMSVRQQEEYSSSDRKKMYTLPQDFVTLSDGLTELLRNIFFASRYDESQILSTLRGIYFSSCKQFSLLSLSNNNTLTQRWKNAVSNVQALSLASLVKRKDEHQELGIDLTWAGRPFFLKNLFSDVIIKDAGLVDYDAENAANRRIKRLVFNSAMIVFFVFFMYGIKVSYHNNNHYLDVVDHNLQQLRHLAYSSANDSILPPLLSSSQSLATMKGLDLKRPFISYRYGLYTGSGVEKNTNALYISLLKKFLLPQIVDQARQTLIAANESQDNNRVYDALKNYLMLSGKGTFNKNDAINRVSKQWYETGKINTYGESYIFSDHLDALFSNVNLSESVKEIDHSLVADARAILERKSPSSRIYSRIKSSLQHTAPQNITLNSLLRDVPEQIFVQSDKDLSTNGVPGLFTYDGYYNIFRQHLFQLVSELYNEEYWVVGDNGRGSDARSKILSIQNSVLKMYLDEYTNVWNKFISSIHVMSPAEEASSAGLPVNIYLLKMLASDNSPMIQLGNQLVKQTTLANVSASQGKSYVPSGQIARNIVKMSDVLITQQNKLLKEYVDNHFMALRTFVTGSAESTGAGGRTMNSNNSSTPLSKAISMLHDQYTLFVISHKGEEGAVNLLSDSGQKLSAESQTWPAPFQNIVEPLLDGTSKQINNDIVSHNVRNVASGLGDECRNIIRGRYPFAQSAREISIRDFERLFGYGGVIEDYFNKNLADKVDVSSHPWHYKDSSDSAGLRVFEQAQAIRNAFFNGSDNSISLDISLSVSYLEPSITQLDVNVNNKNFRYLHGPVIPFNTQWPGLVSGGGITLTARPHMGNDDYILNENSRGLINPLRINGTWALFRLADKASSVAVDPSGQQKLTFYFDNRKVELDVSGITYGHRSMINMLKSFRCPG